MRISGFNGLMTVGFIPPVTENPFHEVPVNLLTAAFGHALPGFISVLQIPFYCLPQADSSGIIHENDEVRFLQTPFLAEFCVVAVNNPARVLILVQECLCHTLRLLPVPLFPSGFKLYPVQIQNRAVIEPAQFLIQCGFPRCIPSLLFSYSQLHIIRVFLFIVYMKNHRIHRGILRVFCL